MLNVTGDIAQMIDTYTGQIEKYESISTWYAAFCMICILGVIALAVFLILRDEGSDSGRESRNGILSAVFLIIPSVTTLFLYVFSMNMRKVALYRGYLSFLEKEWNFLAGGDRMLFNSRIIGEFFSFRSFLVNGLGPAVMALFVVISVILGFGMSLYFGRKLKPSRWKSALLALTCVLSAVCILFDGVCVYYLSTNDRVVEMVIECCGKVG